MDPVSNPAIGLIGFLVFAAAMGSVAVWGYDGIPLGPRSRTSFGWLALALLGVSLLMIVAMAWYQ